MAAATARLLDHPAPYGLYHCVNTGWTTWAEIARELARLVGRPAAPILEVPLARANLLTPRPRFAALSNAKLADAGIHMPSWQEALESRTVSPTSRVRSRSTTASSAASIIRSKNP